MGKYKVVKKLGQGSYGTVYLVQDSKDNQYFVMKKITVSGMGEQELADCKKEIQILSVMKHPNIIRYKRSFVRRGALCIVMEFADGGDLHQLIRQQRHAGKYLAESQILDWFTQACLGLKHVHDHKILHRDLKTQNIFLTSNNEVRLGDFGISRVLKNTMDQAHTLVGTPYYLSPEMVNGQPYDHRSDIWSMGVVLYEMLTLQHPFNADSLQMLALKIIQGNYPPIPKQYSEGVNDLLSKMLKQDAKQRLDIDGVLAHPIIEERVERFRAQQAENEAKEQANKPRKAPGGKSGKSPSRPEASPGDDDDDGDDDDGDEEGKAETSPSPAPSAGHGRKGSVHVNEKMPDQEPDWDVDANTAAAGANASPNKPAGSSSSAAASSGADDGKKNTQVDILRAYLEERLGPARLNKIIQTLESDLDDKTKQKNIEKLTKGNSGLLPIVHTLMYLTRAAQSSE
jgi:NIMA (never in mitosis gene a)-related kinase